MANLRIRNCSRGLPNWDVCFSARTATSLVVAEEWQRSQQEFAGLVYGHQLQVTIGQVVRDLELVALCLDPEDMRNRIEFLPL